MFLMSEVEGWYMLEGAGAGRDGLLLRLGQTAHA
jgi:hypothetical protein